MFWLGRARFGRIIRFVPYPVFGGFLAITGWYLLRGGMETVVGYPLNLQNLGSLFESGTGIKVGLAAAFVLLVQVFNTRVSSGALLPIAIIATIVSVQYRRAVSRAFRRCNSSNWVGSSLFRRRMRFGRRSTFRTLRSWSGLRLAPDCSTPPLLFWSPRRRP